MINLLVKQNSALLEKGTLYVANMGSGKWVPLTMDTVPKQQKDKRW